jgi:2-(3-amino-3-carboxypropyl)histidine synthase
MPNYKIDFKPVIEKINKKNIKIIALQIPEGLKHYSYTIVEHLKKNINSEIIVVADPCFGACDIADNELGKIGAELIIHLGHTPILNSKKYAIPVEFVNAFSSIDIKKVINNSLKYLKGKKIKIVTTAQHIHKLDEVKKILENHNFNAIISKGNERIAFEGQVLGCNFSVSLSNNEDYDCILFLGSGTFHPLGLILNSKKPVVVADPYTNTVKKDEIEDLKDQILRQRYGAIANSKNSKIFGILVGLKTGQQRIKLVNEIKKLLIDHQKKYLIISMNYFLPTSLEGFRDIDCFVSTACPRIAIDDYLKYKKPIITPIELEILLDKRVWEDYEFDQIL